MKKIKFMAISIFGLFNLCFAAEESITITTYYPSPYGSYNSLQTNKLGVGDNNGDGVLTSSDVPTASGDMLVKDQIGINTSVSSLAATSSRLYVGGDISTNDIYLMSPKSGSARWAGDIGLFKIVTVVGTGAAAICVCPSGYARIACSGSRESNVQDTCGESNCGYVGVIPTATNGCKTGVDAGGEGTEPVATCYCMKGAIEE